MIRKGVSNGRIRQRSIGNREGAGERADYDLESTKPGRGASISSRHSQDFARPELLAQVVFS
jgi:hypothetical protein